MNSALKKSLEELLHDWLEEESSGEHWPDEGLVHNELAKHMVEAAAAVFDATFASSLYTSKEGF